jgi:beta-1,4-mannosyltransferase
LVAGLYSPPTGPGSWRDRLQLAYRKRADRRLLVHGYTIESARIQDYANAADCLVLSHTSGLNSGVAVLGMTFGKPLIGPDLGCLGWVLRAGDNCIYPTGDVAALTAAMQGMFAAPDRLQAMGERNRQAAQEWRWERIAAGVLQRLGLHQ